MHKNPFIYICIYKKKPSQSIMYTAKIYLYTRIGHCDILIPQRLKQKINFSLKRMSRTVYGNDHK